MFVRYIGSWGEAAVSYQIEGYRNGEKVITREKGQGKRPKLVVEADSEHLIESSTYDVTRIMVRCLDEYGSELSYAQDPIQISVTGAAKLLGPNQISLIGGTTAFWIRTIGVPGRANIRIDSPRFGKHQLSLKVDIESPNHLTNTAPHSSNWSHA